MKFCTVSLSPPAVEEQTVVQQESAWFLPGQTSPVVGVNAPNAGTESFTRSRGPSAVLLNCRTGTVGPTGLFTCQVPDGSGTNRTLYIGVGAGTDLSCDMHSYVSLPLCYRCSCHHLP